MTTHTVGIVMNGVTGRMGLNQHLRRSIQAIVQQGGVRVSESETIVPRVLLVGRNSSKLEAISAEWRRVALDHRPGCRAGQLRVLHLLSTRRPPTGARPPSARPSPRGSTSIAKKPVTDSLKSALDLWKLAEKAGVKHGVVEDKLWLPGLAEAGNSEAGGILRAHPFRSRRIRVLGFRRRHRGATSARRGITARKTAAASSWTCCAIGAMYWTTCFGAVKAVSCLGATHIPRRWNEAGQPYDCTAEDAAYATFELEGGVVAHFNSSWCVRVRRDDLLTIQVEGTKGSALAGLRHCWIQPYGETPRPVWNPDIESPLNYFDGWREVEERTTFDNAFKRQWELFLRHVVKGDPFRWGLLEGAKGVQLAEKGLESWRQRAWVEVPEL